MQDGVSRGARAPSRAVPCAPRGTAGFGLFSERLEHPGVSREARNTAGEAPALPETHRSAFRVREFFRACSLLRNVH